MKIKFCIKTCIWAKFQKRKQRFPSFCLLTLNGTDLLINPGPNRTEEKTVYGLKCAKTFTAPGTA